jgi:DNA (cytosine-5)-methyltransferase 1
MLQAGHEIVAAYDNDPVSIETYNANLPGQHAHLSDLRELSAADLPDCDGIIGGPPCQPFSNGHRNDATRKGPSDKRNALPAFVRLVVEKRPRMFLFENVPGLLQYPDFVAQHVMRPLFDAGYLPVPAILQAWRFGVPQERRRLFVIGYQGGKLPQWPAQTHTRARATTWQALGHLLTSETARDKPPWIHQKFEGRDRIETDTRNRGYTRSKGRYFHARSIDLPAYTVLASERRGSKVIVIGEQCWSLGIEHNRILQAFPGWWTFPREHDDAQRLIGNAVPPTLAQRLGEAIR